MLSIDLACRAAIAVVFALAAASKLRGRGAFADVVATLGQLGAPSLAKPVFALALIAGELAVVVALAIAARAGYGLAGALLAMFALAMTRAVRRGRSVRCRCFGASELAVGASQIARNLVVTAIAVAGALSAPAGDAGLDGLDGLDGLATGWPSAAAGALLGLAITRWDDFVFLFGAPSSASAKG